MMSTHRASFLSAAVLVLSAGMGCDEAKPVVDAAVGTWMIDAPADPAKPADASAIDSHPTIDAVPAIDAKPADTSCTGDPSPAFAADPVLLGGVAKNLLTSSPVAGVALEVRRFLDDVPVAATTTGADGAFTLVVPTGGTPMDGYGRGVKDGYATTYFFPADPVTKDVSGLEMPIFEAPQVGLVYLVAGEEKTEGTATSVVMVTDCAGQPVQGAVVTFSPPAGKVAYLKEGTTAIDSAATTTSSAGVALGLNLPTGLVSVSASVDGAAYETHRMKSVADALILTSVHP